MCLIYDIFWQKEIFFKSMRPLDITSRSQVVQDIKGQANTLRKQVDMLAIWDSAGQLPQSL